MATFMSLARCGRSSYLCSSLSCTFSKMIHASSLLTPVTKEVGLLVNKRWYSNFFIDSDYKKFSEQRVSAMNRLLKSSSRFQSIDQREERGLFPMDVVMGINGGKVFTHHRGVFVCKTPEDLVIYSEFLCHVKPATLFEIGSYTGGSALWMTDIMKLNEIDCRVYSVDIDHSLLDKKVKELQPNNLTFIEGDCCKIEELLAPDFLRDLPHPWIISEDAHANFHGVLAHFHKFMQPNDYFVIDDTNPHMPAGFGPGTMNSDFTPIGPNKLQSMKSFFSQHSDKYLVDTFFTDMFGYNASCNWDGYIKRVA